MKAIAIATFAAALLVGSICQAAQASYVCGDPASGFNVRLTLGAKDGAARFQDFSHEQSLASAGTGKWQDGDIAVTLAGGKGLPTLTIGAQQLPCVAGAADKAAATTAAKPAAKDGTLDVSARSWGGKLRAGPGQTFAKVGSLAELAPVTLVKNAGVRTDGMDWFEIKLPGGKRGFQWGGVLCVVSQPVDGVFGFCPAK